MSRWRSDLTRRVNTLRRAALARIVELAARVPAPVAARSDLSGPVVDVEPSEGQLKRWASAIGLEYQAWCFHHGFVSLDEWRRQRRAGVGHGWEAAPFITILTPVYNTPPEFLRECVYSVQAQSWPYWQLCLVDDASTDEGTIAELDRLDGVDSRIQVKRLSRNLGICDATNEALAMATGTHVGFLDHDDRLAPDALHHVAQRLLEYPEVDIVYTDRDLLTPDNFRIHHTFKPGWGPETLLSGNYLFHLMLYRRPLLERLGGYRKEYEGSQDLDLILRAAETDPHVDHVPRVLYHWRQHSDSMALDPESKPFIFDAGINAVKAALERRGLKGWVEEVPNIWRGNYVVRLEHTDSSTDVIQISDVDRYRAEVASALAATKAEYLVVLGPGVDPDEGDAVAELTSWLQIPGVGAVTGRVEDAAGERIRHVGLVRRPGGIPKTLYAGYPATEPGYAAGNATIRNVSLAHPLCAAWRVHALRTVGGVDGPFDGPHAGLDASVRADATDWRTVYNPLARFRCADPTFDPDQWPVEDAESFGRLRAEELESDVFFNPSFDPDAADMRVDVRCPTYPVDFDPPV